MYVNDESVENDYQWQIVEIRGPVRSGYPDFGKHQKAVRVPVDKNQASMRRWKEVRDWVARHLEKQNEYTNQT